MSLEGDRAERNCLCERLDAPRLSLRAQILASPKVFRMGTARRRMVLSPGRDGLLQRTSWSGIREVLVGEKGNAEAGSLVAAAGTSTTASLIERTTTNVTETVVGTTESLVGTIRDKAIGAVAEEAIAAAREKVQGEAPPNAEAPPKGESDNPPPV